MCRVMGCWHCRRWLNVLPHSTSPSVVTFLNFSCVAYTVRWLSLLWASWLFMNHSKRGFLDTAGLWGRIALQCRAVLLIAGCSAVSLAFPHWVLSHIPPVVKNRVFILPHVPYESPVTPGRETCSKTKFNFKGADRAKHGKQFSRELSVAVHVPLWPTVL